MKNKRFRKKEAAVFFVDILGINALTRGSIDIDKLKEEINLNIYSLEFDDNNDTITHQNIAAWILEEFRIILCEISKKYNVKISQLSDCAFIWSEESGDLLLASSEFMWRVITSGILCRGGLSYGEVIEPYIDNREIGNFLVGDAVTLSVQHEKSGKGCRIFTDSNAIATFWKNFPYKKTNPNKAHEIYNAIFQPMVNPVDYSILDEFKWYLFFDLEQELRSNCDISHPRHALYMGGLVSLLRFSPFFAWNTLTKEGLVHLAASIEAISSNIEYHTGNSDMKLSAEDIILWLPQQRKSNQRIINFLRSYCVDIFSSNRLFETEVNILIKKISNE